MAKQKGLIKTVGTIDDLTCYPLNGVYIIRQKSGFPSGKKRKHKRFKKTVENSSDFGKASSTGAALRRLLYQYVRSVGDKTHHSRFQSLMISILRQDNDEESRGKRKFTGNNFKAIEGFHFNEAAEQATNANLIVKHSIDVVNNSASISGTLYPNDKITSCTHIQLSQLVLLFNFETKTGKLIAKDELYDHQGQLEFSSTLPYPKLPDATVAIHLICIQYFQEVNGELYPVNRQYNDLMVLEGKGV